MYFNIYGSLEIVNNPDLCVGGQNHGILAACVSNSGPFRQSNRFVSIVITTHAVRQVRYKYILIDGNFFIWCCTMERRQGTPLMSHHHGRRLPPLAMHDLSLVVDFGNLVSSVWRRPLGRPPRLDLEGIKFVDLLQRQACTVDDNTPC